MNKGECLRMGKGYELVLSGYSFGSIDGFDFDDSTEDRKVVLADSEWSAERVIDEILVEFRELGVEFEEVGVYSRSHLDERSVCVERKEGIDSIKYGVKYELRRVGDDSVSSEELLTGLGVDDYLWDYLGTFE